MMGNVNGRSDAIGPQEQLEVVFEESTVALQTYNGCFLSVTEDGELSATKKVAEEREKFRIRTNIPKRSVCEHWFTSMVLVTASSYHLLVAVKGFRAGKNKKICV